MSNSRPAHFFRGVAFLFAGHSLGCSLALSFDDLSGVNDASIVTLDSAPANDSSSTSDAGAHESGDATPDMTAEADVARDGLIDADADANEKVDADANEKVDADANEKVDADANEKVDADANEEVDADAPEATAPRLVDCKETPSEPACSPIDDLSPGSLGSGPVLDWADSISGADVRTGLVDGNRLIASVRDRQHSALMTFDLTSGARELLSGNLANYRGDVLTKGDGPALQAVTDVDPLPDGWVVLEDTDPLQWLMVDRTTGNRAVIRTLGTFQCSPFDGLDLYPVPTVPKHMATDPEGALYHSVRAGNAVGIVKWLHGTCTIVTLFNTDLPGQQIGDGYSPNTFDFTSLSWVDQILYSYHWTSQTILAVDVVSGDRRIVSRSGTSPIGAGDALATGDCLAASSQALWSIGGPHPWVTQIDPVSGDRIALEMASGPIAFASDSDLHVWQHPDQRHLVIEADDAILVYDPATGNSNVLSY